MKGRHTMGAWYIVQTNPICETKAVEEIRRAGFRAYLPKAAQDTRHHRTKATIIKRRPALVGYLFMRFPDDRPDWYTLRQCQGVKGVLYMDGKPYELAQQQIAALMRAQRSAAFDTETARTFRLAKRRGERQSVFRAVARAKFKPGMRVKASSGPWQHIMAHVEGVTKTGSVKVLASMFGQETAMEFPNPDELEVVEESA